MARRPGRKLQSNEHGTTSLLLLAAIGGPVLFMDLAVRYGHWVVQTWSRVLPGVEKRLEQNHERSIDSEQTDAAIEKLLCMRRHGPKVCIR